MPYWKLICRRLPCHPAAARALRETGLAVGMAAAGITGSCNPVAGSSAFMWAAAGNGSWRGIEPGELSWAEGWADTSASALSPITCCSNT